MKARYELFDCCNTYEGTVEIDVPEDCEPDGFGYEAVEEFGYDPIELCESCGSRKCTARFIEVIE